MVEEVGYDVRRVYKNGNSFVITLPKSWVSARFYKIIRDGKRIILEPNE